MKKILLTLAFLMICHTSFAATYTAGAGGGNWSSNATWGGGGFPGAADTAVLNGTSGSVTVDVPSTCLTLTATNYNTNLVMTSTLTMATGGTCTLPSGASGQLTGTGALILNGTNALTTNGKAIPTLTYGTTGTKTITGNSTIATLNVSSATTHNGLYTLTVSNISLMSTLAGTTTVQFGTAGTHSGTSVMSCPVTWSGNGAINVTGNITYTSFDHTSYTGTFAVGSGVLCSITGTTTLNASATYASGGAGASIRWSGASNYNIKTNGVILPYDLSFNTSNVKTLLDNWTMNSGAQLIFLTSASTINGYKIVTKGTVNTTAGMSGTTVLEAQTGTIFAGGAGGCSCPINLNGDVTFSNGTIFVYGGSGTITRTTGTITTTGHTLSFISAATLTTPGMTWGTIVASGAATVTLSQDIVLTGGVATSGGAALTMNGYTCTFEGSLGGVSGSQGIAGTTEFIWNGTTCTWNNSSFTMNGKFTINSASGTLTLGNCAMGTAGTPVLKYVHAGSVVNSSGSNYLNIYGGITLNVNGMPAFWNALYISNTGTYTLASDLHCNVIQFVGAYVATWTSAFDIYCTNLNSISAGGGNCTFKIPDGKHLYISLGIDFATSKGTTNTISSNTATVKSYLVWQNAYFTNQFITRTNFTDIDASGSTVPIYTYSSQSSITRCVKVYTLTGYSINGGTTITNF